MTFLSTIKNWISNVFIAPSRNEALDAELAKPFKSAFDDYEPSEEEAITDISVSAMSGISEQRRQHKLSEDEAYHQQKLVEALKTDVLKYRAMASGMSVSPNLDKRVLVVNEEGELADSNEKEMVTALLEEKESGVRGTSLDAIGGNSSGLLEITSAINIWNKLVTKAAGNRMVVWSPNTVQSKATFDKDGLMHERVYVERSPEPEANKRYAFMPPGARAIENSEVKSIRVDDLMNPHSTVYKETEEDRTLAPLSFEEILTARKAAFRKIDDALDPLDLSNTVVATPGIKADLEHCSPELKALVLSGVTLEQLDEFSRNLAPSSHETNIVDWQMVSTLKKLFG